MHDPAVFAHHEGVNERDGQVVHGLRRVDDGDGFERAVGAVSAQDFGSGGQISGGDPGPVAHVEGVLGGGVDGLAVDGQVEGGFVWKRKHPALTRCCGAVSSFLSAVVLKVQFCFLPYPF